MSDPITVDSIDVSIASSLKRPHARPAAETPFRILIMGDFSGRTNRGGETDGTDIAGRRLYRVDRDTDEAVMEKMGAALRLPAAGPSSPPVDLAFVELDDFHPDTIYQRVPLFKLLRTTRRRLMDPATFAETAAAISGKARPVQAAPPPSSTAAPSVMPAATGLLDQILDVSAAAPAAANGKRPASDWDRFIDQLVGPYLVPDIEKAQAELVAGVDRAIAGMMNAILHHPDFQTLESTWRALQWMLRRLDTGEQLQIELLDLTRAELAASLTGADDIADTTIHKKLAAAGQVSAGAVPWSLLVGLYTFGKTRAEAVVLARAGAMGQALNAPFVAAAADSVIDCGRIAETPDPVEWTVAAPAADDKAWQVVRSLPEAAWVGLAMPRFLIRLPYGEASDAVEGFDFEEMPETPVHGHYLWAHPAVAVALVLGRSFTRSGWDLLPHLENRIDGLPLHLFDRHGERVVKPCCEVQLSERALARMIDAGVMPLVGFKDQDQAALVRVCSLALPYALLAGRW